MNGAYHTHAVNLTAAKDSIELTHMSPWEFQGTRMFAIVNSFHIFPSLRCAEIN